ncbi:MAG: S41 family peptidase [Phaeodactylibacter sp.]|nr:S41 family peptidase [Phaeodactylibacter sp.]
MKSYLFTLLTACVAVSFPALVAAQSHPEKNFEAFWEIMDEHYAFFELKGVDWQAVYDTYRPKVKPTTSDEALFELLTEILEPFQDGHISLKTGGEMKFSGGRPSNFESQFPTDSLKRAYFQLVEAQLQASGFDTLKQEGPLLSAKTALYDHSVFEHTASEQFAYIKVSWFFYDWQQVQKLLRRKKDRQQFLAAFDGLLQQYANKEGLILDLRNNIGGVSGYPERLVGRFVKAPFVGEYTCSRKNDGHEAFTTLKPTKVKPAKTIIFNNPVIVLVNGETVSAAEEFVQMMRGLPRILIVGKPTQGALSDIYAKDLPNGWTLSLSNMRFYDRNKACWEGKGIPVDWEVSNDKSNLETGEDPVLQKALQLLSQ